MSYTGWLEIDTGGAEPAEVAEIGNYTANVAPMWRAALTVAYGQPTSLADLDGRVAGEILGTLRVAVADMEDNPAGYKAANPSNGWGDYAGALDYLRTVVAECAKHPKATLRWNH